MDEPIPVQAQRLVSLVSTYGRCVVAFSAGVDSAVVAKAARLALGANAIAVTAVSPSLALGELEQARQVAAELGIEHREIQTDEFSNPNYVQNGPNRCYFCKSELFEQLGRLAELYPGTMIVSGTNADDVGDYRPGLQAALEHRVASPLAQLGLRKEQVRALAAYWELSVWNKPATPCLSSRVAYGEEVTPARLRMIDRAEQFLRDKGLSPVRVRYHRGDLARLEVSLDAIIRLADPPLRQQVADELHRLGFRFVTLDLEGFQSGSLNRLVVLQ